MDPKQRDSLSVSSNVVNTATLCSKEWHKSASQDLRTHIIMKIIEAIGSVFPKNGVTVPRETYRNLSTYARKTEADIFYRANSRSDYYHLISDKIYKLQKDITKKVEEMKEPPAAANRTHQQPSQEHVTPGHTSSGAVVVSHCHLDMDDRRDGSEMNQHRPNKRICKIVFRTSKLVNAIPGCPTFTANPDKEQFMRQHDNSKDHAKSIKTLDGKQNHNQEDHCTDITRRKRKSDADSEGGQNEQGENLYVAKKQRKMLFEEEDWKDETLKSRIAGHLECPVCLHIPDTSPVFQCNNGHTICCRCRVKMNKCPVCRVTLGYSRSLTSEKLISLLSLTNNEEQIDESV